MYGPLFFLTFLLSYIRFSIQKNHTNHCIRVGLFIYRQTSHEKRLCDHMRIFMSFTCPTHDSTKITSRKTELGKYTHSTLHQQGSPTY